MIELKNFTCSYEKKSILKNINLLVENNLTILGANGSGKSTLAKAICNLIKYDGEIKIDSVDVKNLSLKQRAKTISYIPAKLEIYDEFIEVEEFVLLGRFAYKNSFFNYSKKDKEIVQDVLKFLNISHLKKHSVGSLSSGEQQLTLIAQALSSQSKIIIFDEPTANLDPNNSKVVAKHIKDLKLQHQIILITHDLKLASFLKSEAIFIKDNSIIKYKDDFDFSTLEVAYE